MRWECNAEGLEGNWLEVSEQWTRAEEKALDAAKTDAEFFAIFRAKVTACRLTTATGQVITDPAAVEAAVDDMDVALLQGIGFSLRMAVAERRRLGNASWRASSNGAAPSARASAAKVRRSPKAS